VKTIHQLSQSVSSLNAFLGTFYLLLTLAATDAPAGEKVNHQTLKDDAAHLAEIGEATDAMNFVQNTRDETTHPDVARVRYDRTSDRFYWKGPVTGKDMSLSREDFECQIFAPYYLFTEIHWKAVPSKPNVQTLRDDAAEIAEVDEATDAMNFIQSARDAVEDFKAVKEGSPVQEWPNVSLVWYDRATDHFHWKGPTTGKIMSMSREDFECQIFAPYYLWLESHRNY
jgi:hypothetical protein